MMKLWIAGLLLATAVGSPAQTERVVSWGTLLNPDTVVAEARRLAQSLANPQSMQWRAKGDQKRSYRFDSANATVPYRLVIPSGWDGASPLPLMVFLHSGGANENTNLDANNKQLVNLANRHGYALLSPLGYQGAYGFHLRLPAVFGQQASADQQIAAVTASAERTNQLSERDVLNVLEIVLNEYPIDPRRMFLAGHSMGAGGTWYLGAKYPDYWAALAPLSGPFVHREGYPWDNIRPLPVFVTEGNNTASTAASRAVHEYMAEEGFDVTYKEVVADHEGMIALVLEDVFAFFNGNPKPSAIPPSRRSSAEPARFSAKVIGSATLRIRLPASHSAPRARVALFNAAGYNVMTGVFPAVGGGKEGGDIVVNGLSLPGGVYHARITAGAMEGFATFFVMN